MSEKVPQEILERIRRVEHLVPGALIKAALEVPREEALDLLAASIEASSEALLSSKARFYARLAFLGDIEDPRRQQAEAHHVRDCYQESQLYAFQLSKLQTLYGQLLQGNSKKMEAGKKRAPVIRLLPESFPVGNPFPDDDGAA